MFKKKKRKKEKKRKENENLFAFTCQNKIESLLYVNKRVKKWIEFWGQAWKSKAHSWA